MLGVVVVETSRVSQAPIHRHDRQKVCRNPGTPANRDSREEKEISLIGRENH